MRSHLFRRETERRLRATAGLIARTYQQRRYPWLAAYGQADDDYLVEAVEALGDSVLQNDPRPYRAVSAHHLESMLSAGMPPIAILAAADLFYGIVLAQLTPDQRELVLPFVESEHRSRQRVLYERVILARGA